MLHYGCGGHILIRSISIRDQFQLFLLMTGFHPPILICSFSFIRVSAAILIQSFTNKADFLGYISWLIKILLTFDLHWFSRLLYISLFGQNSEASFTLLFKTLLYVIARSYSTRWWHMAVSSCCLIFVDRKYLSLHTGKIFAKTLVMHHHAWTFTNIQKIIITA